MFNFPLTQFMPPIMEIMLGLRILILLLAGIVMVTIWHVSAKRNEERYWRKRAIHTMPSKPVHGPVDNHSSLFAFFLGLGIYLSCVYLVISW
jgi:hypothetical protein